MKAPHKPEDAGRRKAPEFAGEVSATMLAATCDVPDEVGAPGDPGDADDLAEPQARPRVGRYAILSLLGRGGMGAVYAAYDPDLDRKVALKLLHPDAVAVDSARMMQEARTLAKLAHPNVVTVHEVADVLVSMGNLALARGRADQAVPRFERAVKIRSGGGIPPHELEEARLGLEKARAALESARAGK